MGSSTSKPSSNTQHVFASDHPVRFSESLVTSLQSSPETDSTRAKNLELIIQQRVTAELEKHLADSTSKLSSLADSISQEPYDTYSKPSGSSSPSTPTSKPSLTEKPLFDRIAETITGGSGSKASSSSSSSSSQQQQQAPLPGAKALPDTNSVTKELEELRRKLNARPKVRESDPAVEKAKEDVVACLKRNDKRPLDCWKEVDTFKAEVAKLERSYVTSIV